VQFRGEVATALKHLEKKHEVEQIFVIGGPIILNQAKPVIERIFLTRIPGEYINDTFIDINAFLDGFELVTVRELDTCKIEEYRRCDNI
jgi:dihydrofolate reductase